MGTLLQCSIGIRDASESERERKKSRDGARRAGCRRIFCAISTKGSKNADDRRNENYFRALKYLHHVICIFLWYIAFRAEVRGGGVGNVSYTHDFVAARGFNFLAFFHLYFISKNVHLARACSIVLDCQFPIACLICFCACDFFSIYCFFFSFL